VTLDQILLERKKCPECRPGLYVLTSGALSPEVHTRETKGDKGDWDRALVFSAGEYTATLMVMVTEVTLLLQCPDKIF
jgi:hypothetical protein